MPDPIPGSLAAEIKKRQPFESPAQEAYLNLLRTTSVLQAPLEKVMKQFGISPAKYNILRILRGSQITGESDERGLPSLEIADRMITRVPDITRLVDGLEEDGLVLRTRCKEDRRVVHVGITPPGLGLLERMEKPMSTAHLRLMSHLTVDELADLNRLLVKARRAH